MQDRDSRKWLQRFLDAGFPATQARCLVDLYTDLRQWSRRRPATAWDALKHYQRLRDADFTETQARAVIHACLSALTGAAMPKDRIEEAA